MGVELTVQAQVSQGGDRNLRRGANDAARHDVAAVDPALGIGHRPVQMHAVTRQGTTEGNQLQRAIDHRRRRGRRKAQSRLGQAPQTRHNHPSLQGFSGGKSLELMLEILARGESEAVGIHGREFWILNFELPPLT